MHLVRLLVAVVDEGHFGRAAGRLFISAPSLSQQIRKLERALGTELLDRSSHPVRPTRSGTLFLAEARMALAAADRAVLAVEAHRREVSNTLRVGFMTASTGVRMRHILDGVRRRAPGVCIELEELPWPQQTSAVLEGIVDAALVRPPVTDSAGMRLDIIRHESRVAVLPSAHRLARRPSICIADLDGEAHVTDDEADPDWVRWWACDPRPSGIPVPYGPSVRTMDELLEVVATEQAIAITGEFVAESYRSPEVVFVPIIDIEPCPLSLCTRAADTSPLVAELRRAVFALNHIESPPIRHNFERGP